MSVGTERIVSVIDTSTNTVVDTVAMNDGATGVAITPDGTRAYVTNSLSHTVSVVDTASDTVIATVVVGPGPQDVAITPDGAHAYVTNPGDNTVSVIDTSTNTVTATVPAGRTPYYVAITPLVTFSAFTAKLDIFAAKYFLPAGFDLPANFTLGAGGTIDPVTEPVTLQVGTYQVTVPPGSFVKGPLGAFNYYGTIDGVCLLVRIAPTGDGTYRMGVLALGTDLTGLNNPVTVGLKIGNDGGTTSVIANFE